MNNLQKLRQAIIKEIPEIVELKFGCEVRIPIRHCVNSRSCGVYMRKHIIVNSYNTNSDCIVKRVGYKNNKALKVSEDWEIIGRTITLADVLRVLNKLFRGDFYIRDDGYFYRIVRDINDGEMQAIEMVRPGIEWNLSKNNLSLQSEEIIDFLAEIILKKQ